MSTKHPRGKDRLCRHCYSAKHFRDSARTFLTGDTFAPRDTDEYLSVNWLEYHRGTDEQRIRAVCKDLAAKRRLKRKDKLGIIQVERAQEIGAVRGQHLWVTHEPWGLNLSHSGIRGVKPDAKLLHEELAAEASKDIRDVVLPNPEP